jgi:hypothetical protein
MPVCDGQFLQCLNKNKDWFENMIFHYLFFLSNRFFDASSQTRELNKAYFGNSVCNKRLVFKIQQHDVGEIKKSCVFHAFSKQEI